jgi:hypothetical protein
MSQNNQSRNVTTARIVFSSQGTSPTSPLAGVPVVVTATAGQKKV